MPNATLLGIDVTTGELALAVRSDSGDEGYAATAMQGQTHWNDDEAYPAFDLVPLPKMLLELFGELESSGWSFAQGGKLSISCRQHDMVLLDGEAKPLAPALSWQCNAARAEADAINHLEKIAGVVGPVEPRLILPKLRHVLSRDASLRQALATALTTGDWIAHLLTGERTLHTSEARSNGLLDPTTRKLAADAIAMTGLDPNWFPPVIESGEPVGIVTNAAVAGDSADWKAVRENLRGWEVVAGMGDNHASALGCGVYSSEQLLVSMGTSGTVNWVRPTPPPAESKILGFDYHGRSLWLLMLGRCAAAYNDFLDDFVEPGQRDHAALNALANEIDPAQLQGVGFDGRGEFYRAGFVRQPLGLQVASVQFAITAELVRRIGEMQQAMLHTRDRQHPKSVVLTGGLSQSAFIQTAFHAGVKRLLPDASVRVSGRQGPLRYKTTAYGALINAEFGPRLIWPMDGGSASSTRPSPLPAERFPLVDVPPAEPKRAAALAAGFDRCLAERE